MSVAAPAVRVLSLCSGGGGLDLAVRWVIRGARTVLYVERDIPAVALLASRIADGSLDDALVWDDIRTVDCGPLRGRVDCVIGGIPCQPHSYAGKRLGAADPRDLWPDAFRIIRDTGCRLAFIENVGGSLREYHRVWRRDLEGIGFRVKEIIVSAADVGATHGRPRLFILAVADTDDRERDGRQQEPGRRPRGRSAAARSGRAVVADRDSGGLAAVAGTEAQRPDVDDSDAAVGDTEHGAGGTEHEQQSADGLPLARAASGGVQRMDDAAGRRLEPGVGLDAGQPWGGYAEPGESSPQLADAERIGRVEPPAGGRDGARSTAGAGGAGGAGEDGLGVALGNPDRARRETSGLGRDVDAGGEPETGSGGMDGETGVGLADSGRERPQGLGTGGAASGAARRGGRAGVDWRYAPPGNPYDKHGRLVDPAALAEWQRVIAVRPDLAPATQPDVRGVADGAPRRVGEPGSDLTRAMKLHILGNGVVPDAAAAALTLLMQELGVDQL